MGGNSTKQTTNTTSLPSWIQEPLQNHVTNMTNLYNDPNNKAYQPWHKSAIASFTGPQKQAMQSQVQLANQNMAPNSDYQKFYSNIIANKGRTYGQKQSDALWRRQLQGNTQEQNRLDRLYSNSGYNNDMKMARNDMRQVAQGRDSIDTRRLRDLYRNNTMHKYAEGKMIGDGNPYLQEAIDIANRKAQDAAAMNAIGAGRYGSGTHAKIASNAAADIATTMMANQYNQDVGHMMGASGSLQGLAGDIASIDGQNAAMKQNASQSLFGMGNTAYGNKMGALDRLNELQNNAATNLFNSGQTAQNNVANAFSNQQMPSNLLMQVGNMRQDMKQRQLDEQKQNWQMKHMAPWLKSQAYMSSITNSPIPQLQTNTISQPTQPLWQQLIGPTMFTAAHNSKFLNPFS